jgi:hypothetical protein
MKKCFTGFFLFLFVGANAQFTANAGSWYTPFKKTQYLIEDSASSAFFNPGEGMEWNFSQLSFSGNSTVDIQKQAWYTQPDLPDSMLACNFGNGLVWLYTLRNDGVYLQGIQTGNALWKCASAARRLTFPLSYGQSSDFLVKASYTRDSSFLLVLDSVRRSRTFTGTLSGIAYGNILYNGYSYASMLVKETCVMKDTVSYHNSLTGWFNSLTQPAADTVISYYWWSNQPGFVPALGQQKNNTYTLWVAQAPPLPSGEETAIAEKFTVFPNPAIDEITVSGFRVNPPIRICNAAGQEVLCIPANSSGSIRISLRGLCPGMYYICNNNSHTKLIITDRL